MANTNGVSPGTAREPAHPGTAKKVVSAAKVLASQQNGCKSRGPTTDRGKANSRFNALRHGITSQYCLYKDGTYHHTQFLQLQEWLLDHYGRDNVMVQLLVRQYVTEFWRQEVALECESIQWSTMETLESFRDNPTLPNIRRYATASQNAMLRLQKILDQYLADERTQQPDQACELESEAPETNGSQHLPETEMPPSSEDPTRESVSPDAAPADLEPAPLAQAVAPDPAGLIDESATFLPVSPDEAIHPAATGGNDAEEDAETVANNEVSDSAASSEEGQK